MRREIVVSRGGIELRENEDEVYWFQGRFLNSTLVLEQMGAWVMGRVDHLEVARACACHDHAMEQEAH